jgi:AcrR family transcriptional regulator
VDPAERLRDAGRIVLNRVGYVAATVDDVLAESGTSRATFYRYFRSKEDLFASLSRECFAEMAAVVDELGAISLGPGDRTDLEVLLARYRRLHARHGGVIRAWFERDLRPPPDLQAEASETFDRFIESLARPLRAAAIPSGVDDDVRAALLYLLIERSYYGVSSRWSRLNPDRLAPTLATMIHRAYLGGTAAARSGRLRLPATAPTETPLSGSR